MGGSVHPCCTFLEQGDTTCSPCDPASGKAYSNYGKLNYFHKVCRPAPARASQSPTVIIHRVSSSAIYNIVYSVVCRSDQVFHRKDLVDPLWRDEYSSPPSSPQ